MPPDRDLSALVGRAALVARVDAAIGQARAGSRSTVLVSGSAGIGKTTVIRAALDQAPDVLVGWATCVEGGAAPGYWPWTQVMHALTRSVGVDAARAAAGPDAALLAALAPALEPAADGGPDARPAGGLEQSDRSRLLLLDAMVAWLGALGRDQPVVVVLDDVQWIDESSLALLDVVVAAAGRAGVCVVAAYRHDELDRGLEARLARLVARSEHVHVDVLAPDAARELATRVAGRALSDAEADVIHRRARGHPFFTRELALAATQSDGADQVPAAVRDAIVRRVSRLDETAQQVLRVAAFTGNQVNPDVVATVAEVDTATVAASTSSAGAVGILVTHDDRLRFAHDLFREAIAGQIDLGARPALHLAVGLALEQRSARAADVAASEIARHFRGSLAVGGLERAVHWSRVAAEYDCAALAFAEGAAHLRLLRAAVGDAGLELDDSTRAAVLVAEADALARAGSPSDARGLLRAAATSAQHSGDARLMADVALAVAHLGARFAARRDEIVSELEQAIAAISGSDDALEARLCAALARELQHSVAADRPRARPLSEHALMLGRRAGDPAVLAACLLSRHDVLWTPGGAPERAEIAAEIVQLARRGGDREREAEGLLLQANALLEQGSGAFRAVLDDCLFMLEALGQPRHHYTVETRRACVALLDGDLDDAAARIAAALDLGSRIREPDAENVHMSQRLELVRARAQVDELRSFAAQAVAHWTGAPVHAHAVAAGFLARAGELDAARRHVAIVVELGSWRADRSYLWSVFVRELAYAAVALDEKALCRELLDEVQPLGAGCGVNGAVVAFAGCHAETSSRLLAALGDVEGARDAMIASAAVYARLGAPMPVETEPDAGRRVPGADHASTAQLHRRGAVWEVTFAGESSTVAHSKGLFDIARLVARPGVDVHALELADAGDRSGPSGATVDRRALDAYRRRLVEIDADRADADAANDLARTEALDLEREVLLDEVRVATGLGGRPRSFANHATERARKAVSARIRDAIRKIDGVLPALGAHLDRSVVTGVWCRYRDEGLVLWDVDATPDSVGRTDSVGTSP